MKIRKYHFTRNITVSALMIAITAVIANGGFASFQALIGRLNINPRTHAAAAAENALLAVETWSGGAGDNNWTSNLNWEGVGGAGADDDLIFDSGGTRFSPVNDFAVNTRFRSITISDSRYAITGNQIFLTAGISQTGANGVNGASFTPNIILDANQTFSAQFNRLVMNGVVNLGGHTLNISGTGAGVVFNNIINGTGNLNIGTSGLAFIHDNASAFGPTEIDDLADLKVVSPGVIGAVNLNAGTLHGTGTVGSITASATNGGKINPGLNDGSQAGATGILTVNGASTLNAETELTFNLFGPTIGTQYDRLAVSGAALNLNGASLRVLVGAGFEPSIGQQFTIITQTGAGDITGQFAQGSTVNSGGRFFSITYSPSSIVITNLGNTATWDGSSDTNWSTDANWDVNSGPDSATTGVDLVFPAGAQRIVNTNNISGLSLGSIAFSGTGYEISGQSLSLSQGILNTAAPGSIVFGPALTLTAPQTFSSNAGNLTFTGTVDQGIHRLTIDGAGTHSFSTFNGNSSNPGGGGFQKNGSGTLRLTSNNSTYKGQTIVNAGVLELHSTNPLGAFQDSFDKTTINPGSSLRIINNLQTQETLELNGSGVSGEGAMVGLGCSSCVLNEPVFLLGNSTIGVPTAGRSITFNDQLLGSSTLTKTGAGSLVFNNPSSFSGAFSVNGGAIVVNTNLGSAPVVLNDGTISGSGTVGSISGTGTVAPGSSPGILTVNGSSTFSAGTTLNVELNGVTAGTQYDRLVVTGTTNLGGANLVGSLGFTPTGGQQFTIIQSTGSITGQFAQGSSVNIGGTNFNITYNPNSVVLTVAGGNQSTDFDFNGNGLADVSVFRPSTGVWYIRQPGGSFTEQQWGAQSDRIAPADYDGDGKTDIAVYRPDSGVWFVVSSLNGTFSAQQWGNATDVIVPGDYTGDGRADHAVWRPSEGNWYIRNIANGQLQIVQWGNATDKPVAADFDGDGTFDITAFRPSQGIWFLRHPNGSFDAVQWGDATDKLVPADYDNDGKANIAVWRPSTGVWYILQPGGGFTATQWGDANDLPVAADYDGNGKTNLAVWRPSTGMWYTLNDSAPGHTETQWGSAGDIPTPNAYVR